MADNVVRMEYTGANTGAISFMSEDHLRVYRGGDTPAHKYIDADPRDVEHLERTGRWKRVEVEAQEEPPSDEPALLSTGDVAEALGLADSAEARALIENGELEAEKDDAGRWQIAPAALAQYKVDHGIE